MFELEYKEIEEVIENDIIVDKVDILFFIIEYSNGTSTHSHIKYYFDQQVSR